ncbi:MAG TPA: hypothetical protein VN577_00265 [Terriglobales bacterium]|nr:hypothetical protein [Terriglobales bacterium]
MKRNLLVMSLLVLLGSTLFAQETPRLAITPSRATVVVGQTKMFRAVDARGVPDNSVRWDTPFQQMEGSGADVMVTYMRAGDYEISAHIPGASASAHLKVIEGDELPEGTEKWVLDNLPGCKTKRIIPAVPAAGSDNDVFSVEECPRGQVVRALSAEGLENWRTGLPEDTKINSDDLANLQPKSLLGASVCDNLKVGMTKDETKLAVRSSDLQPPLNPAGDLWTLEEPRGECRITFIGGRVTKWKKIIGN